MKSKEDTLAINQQQRFFYNSNITGTHNSLISQIWSGIRNGPLNGFQKKYKLRDTMYKQHKLWMGDLSEKKVLDLGCFRGNALSLYMAKEARCYVGIDLSEIAIDDLNEKIQQHKLDNAKAFAIDFLSDDFVEKDFDLIYAFGVLHHFENFDLLMRRLIETLKPGGQVISFDPLETSIPIRLLRRLYRPFQEDKDWEWPFQASTFQHIEQYFHVEELRGILGKTKYGFLLHFTPFPRKFKNRIIEKQKASDWRSQSPIEVLNCMQVTMRLKGKGK